MPNVGLLLFDLRMRIRTVREGLLAVSGSHVSLYPCYGKTGVSMTQRHVGGGGSEDRCL